MRDIFCYSSLFRKNDIDFSKPVRLFRTYKKKKRTVRKAHCVIGVNEDSIFNGEHCSLFFDFLKVCSGNVIYVVGTLKEKNILLDTGLIYKCEIIVIEKDFPVFDFFLYTSSALSNYKRAKHAHDLLMSYAAFGKTLSSSYQPQLAKSFFSKVKFKTNYDWLYGAADTTPYQEIFKNSDFRDDRLIIALDVNSMFLHCMAQPFGHPESLYISSNIQCDDFSQLPDGLYHAKISLPLTDYIKKYHPFKISRDFVKYPFLFENDLSVSALLNSAEIAFYSKHFGKIEILGGFSFAKKQMHPLLNRGIKLFNKKNSTSCSVGKKIQKAKIVFLASASSARIFRRKKFNSLSEVFLYIYDKYNVLIDGSKPKQMNDLLRRCSSMLKIVYNSEKPMLLERSFSSPRVVNSFDCEIVMRSRLIISKFLQMLYEIGYVDICYVNVDSVHVSIPHCKRESFYSHLSQYISENDLGKFKIEAEAQKGLWLELGHYYLLSNDEKIIKCKSGAFSKPGMKGGLAFSKLIKSTLTLNGMYFIIDKIVFVSKSFSFKKKSLTELGTVVLNRFSADNLLNDDEFNKSINDEIVTSKNIKMRLLEYIKLRCFS